MIHFGNYTFYQNAIKFNERKMELAESLRLLYVAMTRPKNHLILFGNCGGAEKITASELLFAKANYLNYILGSLPEDAITAINNQVNFMGTGYQVEFFVSYYNAVDPTIFEEAFNEAMQAIASVEKIQ